MQQQLHPKAVWLFFLRSIFLLSVLFLFPGIYLFITIGRWVALPSFLWPLLLIVPLFMIVFAWVWAKLSYRFYRYEFADNGFKKELGVIWKKYVTIPYDRIQNIDIYRGILARILGLSDVHIQTAGSSNPYAYGEGKLPGLSKEAAEQLRDELLKRAKESRSQGL